MVSIAQSARIEKPTSPRNGHRVLAVSNAAKQLDSKKVDG